MPMMTSGCALTRSNVLTDKPLVVAPAVGLLTPLAMAQHGLLVGASGAARTSTTESLPFLWHRRQHGLPEGADLFGSDTGCDWLPLAASRQEWFWRVQSSLWCAVRGGRHGLRLASSGSCVANVVLGSAAFFLVYPLTRRQAEQSLEFLRDLGPFAVCARGMV